MVFSKTILESKLFHFHWVQSRSLRGVLLFSHLSVRLWVTLFSSPEPKRLSGELIG